MLHSTTKYLGGHSDVIGGFVATNDDAIAERLAFLQKSLGAVPGPFDAWLVLRGVKTLAVRMDRHCANAIAVAAFLERHPRVERVLYPGLPSHPGHAIAARQMRNFGGMVSFLLADEQEAVDLVGRTKIWKLAESLGGVESLIEHPARMTHASTADAPFAVPPTLIRLSVGIESAEDLVDDLDVALPAARAHDATRSTSTTRRRGSSPPTCSRRTTAPRSSTAARRRRVAHLKAGLAERGLELTDIRHLLLSHIHLDHAGAAGVLVREHPAAPGARLRDRRAAPRRSVEARRERAPALRRRVRRALGRARARPVENVHVVGDEVVGLDCFPTPGHAWHHVSYLDADGTLYAGDAAGVRLRVGRFVMPPCPPPEFDLEAWEETIAEIERRAPSRLALIHFGVVRRRRRSTSPRCARRSSRWGKRVEDGMDEDDVHRGRPHDVSQTDPELVDEYERAGPYWHHFRGIERYWRKRREAAASDLGGSVRFEVGERDELERRRVRRLEHDRWRDTRLQRLLPARRDDAPAVARLQPREQPLRLRRHEVVPRRDRELEELLRHDRTDDVEPEVGAGRVAVAVAEVARHRVDGTGLQLAAEDVHDASLSVNVTSRPRNRA